MEQRAIINIINMDTPETTCVICATDCTGLRLAIPMYEDFVLPNTWRGVWAGCSACQTCFERQERLTRPAHRGVFLTNLARPGR